jgi:drug/metabolite transporter (DMT)-like permease
MPIGSVICYKLIFGLLTLLVFLAFTEKMDEIKITTKKKFILPIFGSLIYYRRARHLKVQDLCVISLIKPVAGTFFAYMVLHRQILSYTLEGGACILTGVVLAGTKSNACSNTNLREDTIYRYFNREHCP